MSENFIKQLERPLNAEDIEIRVGQSGKNNNGAWCSLLMYKTARTDVKRLNEVFGLNWETDYSYDHKGILKCRIGITVDGQKFWREDVGIESNTEKEKGSYSDAFKRAGFKWGIGLELYKMPFIFINLEKGDYQEKQGKVYPRLSGWRVDFRGDKFIILDKKGKVRFTGVHPTADKMGNAVSEEMAEQQTISDDIPPKTKAYLEKHKLTVGAVPKLIDWMAKQKLVEGNIANFEELSDKAWEQLEREDLINWVRSL